MGWFWNGRCRSLARLDGKTAIITGANTGIGKVTARDFLTRGARVILACRDTAKAEEACREIQEAEVNAKGGSLVVKHLDLSSFASVRIFADEILEEEQALHLLVNNAGVMMCPKMLTEDGYELHFATNHLGHFLLTLKLLPLLVKSAPSRVVNVSSMAHILANSMKFDDINLDKGYKPVTAYARSKLANILFTKELARRLEGKGVNVYSLHPGVVNTELTRHVDTAFFPGSRWLYHAVGSWLMKSPVQGAQTTIFCSVDEQTADQSGLYYE
ncbi:hypothetical protein AAG570_011068 [Ranatra chinensis]|uniref:Retinol dehydrogenase 11 n=1 Tax=Ranatra chinensis TaxID=642074 RepID=A0ABD0YJT6_9HEMI